MAFLIYKKEDGKLVYTGESYKLAGYNLIYKLWEHNGRPIDQGWHISADDLIKAQTNGQESWNTRGLVIDFDPNSTWRIGLIELLGIYIYTFSGTRPDRASWSPMMLRLRDVLYWEFDKEITKEEKEKRIAVIDDPNYEDDFVEFLYLHGSEKGWNWGSHGMKNAPFINGPAREYFKQHF